jgi:hypothetical protein
MRERTKTYITFMGNAPENIHLKDRKRDRSITLKWFLE